MNTSLFVGHDSPRDIVYNSFVSDSGNGTLIILEGEDLRFEYRKSTMLNNPHILVYPV